MKKCVQCTKDLPDAALHCVFCGSKQPAQAPAEVARTVMGYSANQVREQLAAQNAAQVVSQGNPPRHPPSAPPPMGNPMAPPAGPAYASPAPHNPLPPRPMPPPAPSFQPPPPSSFQPPPSSFQPPPAPSFQPPPPAYPAPSAPAFPPPVASSAATLFVPNPNASGPNGGGMGNNMGGGMGGMGNPMNPGVANPMAATMAAAPAPQMMSGGGGYSPSAPPAATPSYAPPPSSSPYQPPSFVAPSSYQPVPVPQSPPYLASQTADRPVDPYRDGLRLVLFAFGILLLGAFCTPLDATPSFHWNTVLADAPLAAKVPSLLLAVVGALSIIIASTPLATGARGLLATLIALLGIVTPIAVARSLGDWRSIVILVAPLLLVPGLLLRQEYREELLPRLFVTVGVIALLALWLVPQGGALPLVGAVKRVVDASGTGKVAPLLELVYLVLVVLTLLVWVPAPTAAGAKLFAWILIFWPAIVHFQGLLLAESPGELIKAQPYASAMVWAGGVAYLAILGYGIAALIGKRYESA